MTTPASIRYSARRPGLATLLLLSLIPMSAGCGMMRRQDAAPPLQFDHTYRAWATVLARCAGPDGFDYVRAKELAPQIEEATAEIKKVERRQFNLFTPDQQLAYLINAHNLAAVRRVVEKYPVNSITGTDPLGLALRRADIELLGGRRSLHGLRNEILSRRYHDPRALFVINWGMAGCAPLPPLPATGDNLDTFLENQTRRFIRNEHYNSFSRKTHNYTLSPLLRQHRGMIEREYTTLRGFLRHFAGPFELKAMELYSPRLVFDRFDTSLNDRPIDTTNPAKPTTP